MFAISADRVEDMDQVVWARDLAERLLAAPLPRRWAHSQGVARRACSIADVLGDRADILIAAAWLHDIGYAPTISETGFHPLDGARYLRNVGADPVLCSLVAHHSCADIEARSRGLVGVLTAEFAPVRGALSDALTFCDMTTTPDGEPTEVESRLAEILERYGEGHLVTESIREASPYIVDAAAKVTELIDAR